MKKLIFLVFILLLIINPVYSQEKNYTYNTDINLNILDFDKNITKIDLEVYDYLTNQLYFVKEIFPEKNEIYSFSKIYPEKLLFKYKIYYEKDLNIITYTINLLENKNDFNILLCKMPTIENCIEQNIFFINDEIYLLSTKNLNYNIEIFDDLENEILKQENIKLPLNLTSLKEGNYVIEIEYDNIRKIKFFKKLNYSLDMDENLEVVKKENDAEIITKDEFENKQTNYLLYILILIILILLLFTLKKKNKKIFFIIISIILISSSIFGNTNEYNQLEITYEKIQEIIDYKEENTFIIRESNNEYILPLLQLDEIIPENEEIKFFTTPQIKDVEINILPFYILLISSEKKQEEFKNKYPKIYNKCSNIFNYYEQNPIKTQQDLLDRSYDNFYEVEKFNSDCVLELVDKDVLVEKIIFYKIKFQPIKNTDQIISFDLFFNIKHLYWNIDTKVTTINLINNNLEDIYFYPTLENLSFYKDLKNNNFNLKTESINNSIFINSYNLKDRELSLQTIEQDKYLFLINDRELYFSKEDSLFFDITDTNYTYQINGFAQLNQIDNSFYINYYLFDNTIFKDNKISTTRNRIKIKNDLVNILFLRNNDDILLERDEKIHRISDNLLAHYSFNQDDLCVFLFELSEKETNYYYNCKKYDNISYFIDLKDLNITNISKNELGTKITIDNNIKISNHFYYPEIQMPEIYFPDKNYFYHINKELTIKKYYFSNNNKYNQKRQENNFSEKLLEKQKYFYDTNNFKEIEKELTMLLDVANTFKIDKKNNNYFIAYLLTTKEHNNYEKIFSQMCNQENYNQFKYILNNTNFKYLKYNFNHLPEEKRDLIINLDFNKNKMIDYNFICDSLILSDYLEIKDFSKTILLATKYLYQEEEKKESINDYYLYNNTKRKFIFENTNQFYTFLSNLIFLEHIYNNSKYPINEKIKKISKHAFLNFKIPNKTKNVLEIKEDIENKFITKNKYIGNCSLLSVDSLNLIFDFPVKYNLADAWYLVGNKNQSIWQIDKDGPLNKKNLFPGIILGIYTGSNTYQYTNFISPYHYDIPQHYIDKGFYTYDSENKLNVPYTHVVSYIGDFGDKKDVILNAGSTGAELLTLDQYVPRGEKEGNWIRRNIVEILVPYGYYTEEEIKNIKKYLTNFN
jgi:hypothetical protein